MRVWVTGTGLVTSLGATREATWERLVRNERQLAPLTLFSPGDARGALVGEVSGLVVPRGSSRTAELARTAAAEAMKDAGFGDGFLPGLRAGLVVGTTTGGMFEHELTLAAMRKNGVPALESDPTLRDLRSHPLSHAADAIASSHSAFVRVRTVCSACSSGANALAVGASWLRSGEVDVVVCGGAEALSRLTFAGFNALGAVDPEPSRPFDRMRRGLNLGEGAGFVVLERSDGVAARGARAIAEFAGWAMGAEAHHVTNPEPTGSRAAEVIARAMSRAGIGAKDVDYVNAHGTGTPLNDAMESAALRAVLGPEIERIEVSSVKGHMGHTLAASGAIEAVLSCLAIERSVLLPTAGLNDPDPACALKHLTSTARKELRAVVSNSFGFGGMDTSLVFTRPGHGEERSPKKHHPVVVSVSSFAPADISAEEIGSHLNLERARRFDRGTRLGVIVADRAKTDANAPPGECALVFSSAFGNVEGSVSFVARVEEKGARFASPIDFPNLVPSAPVGHASVYLGTRGPVVATADLGTSAESALMTAFEWISTGESPWVCAAGIEEKSEIVEKLFSPLSSRADEPDDIERSEGAFAIMLAEEEAARANGSRALARLEMSVAEDGQVLRVQPPTGRAVVIVTGAAESLIPAEWKGVQVVRGDLRSGTHEARGGMAVALGVRAIAEATHESVLVLGASPNRSYAVVLSCV